MRYQHILFPKAECFIFFTQEIQIPEEAMIFLKRTYKQGLEKKRRALAKREYLLVRYLHHFQLGHADPICISSSKKPYTSAFPYLSISHCTHWIALCYSSQVAVGVDIETRQDRLAPIAYRFLHPNEQKELLSIPIAQRASWLAPYWSGKEAAFKASHSNTYSFQDYSLDLAPNEHSKGRLTILSTKEEFYLHLHSQENFYFCYAEALKP